MRRSIILAIAMLNSACGSPDDRMQWTAEKAVRRNLKDPDSAQFVRVYVVRRKAAEGELFDDVAVCGSVNSRNSFAGYTGGERFVVKGVQGGNVLDITYVEFEGSERGSVDSCGDKRATPFESVYWNDHCVDALHPPTYSGERGQLCGVFTSGSSSTAE